MKTQTEIEEKIKELVHKRDLLSEFINDAYKNNEKECAKKFEVLSWKLDQEIRILSWVRITDNDFPF